MADYLSLFARRIALVVGVCLLAISANTAVAQTLVDPTRPPNSPQQSNSAVQPQSQAGLSAVVTAREGVLALFNGETLRVGSRINGGTVTSITAEAVFVRDAKGGTERLPLFPQVKITQTGTQTNAAKNAPGSQPTAAGGRRISAPDK